MFSPKSESAGSVVCAVLHADRTGTAALASGVVDRVIGAPNARVTVPDGSVVRTVLAVSGLGIIEG